MTSYVTLRDNLRSREEDLTSHSNSATPSTPPPEDLATAARTKKMAAPLTPDSFSESEREKMDSTPENIRKIDDVINDHHLHHSNQQADGGLSPRSERYSSSFVPIGLAAAVDDSNAKLCPKGRKIMFYANQQH